MNNMQNLLLSLEKEIHFHRELESYLHLKRKAILNRQIPDLIEYNAIIDTLVLEAEIFKNKREALVREVAISFEEHEIKRLSELLKILPLSESNALVGPYQELIAIFSKNQTLCEQNKLLSKRLLRVAVELLEIFTPGQRMQVYDPQGTLKRLQEPLSSQLEVLA